MEELERRVLDSEEAYSGMKLKMEVVQRENKIYEF